MHSFLPSFPAGKLCNSVKSNYPTNIVLFCFSISGIHKKGKREDLKMVIGLNGLVILKTFLLTVI